MIIVTGAAGFIGSCLVSHLNRQGLNNLLLVDDFERIDKQKNLLHKKYLAWVHRDALFGWLAANNSHNITAFYHLGARTDTTEFNTAIFDKLNLNYSKKVWQWCTQYGVPLVYASSAATYGLGEHGYADAHDIVSLLRPLNPYGKSKNDFDKWALGQKATPPRWYGLKFFNVFGPNEYHKGRMASVVFHAFNQVQKTGSMKLFRSHNPNFEDGKQLRDFIYVKDVVKICSFLMNSLSPNGLYNIGTGKARTFIDLTKAVFHALHQLPNISFIDTPEDIRDKYQYYTQADIQKLRAINYPFPLTSLEEGINTYVQEFLLKNEYF